MALVTIAFAAGHSQSGTLWIVAIIVVEEKVVDCGRYAPNASGYRWQLEVGLCYHQEVVV